MLSKAFDPLYRSTQTAIRSFRVVYSLYVRATAESQYGIWLRGI